MDTNDQEAFLESNALGTSRVVFLVLAAAAPLTAMVASLPIAILLGNGPGVPGAFLGAAIVLLLFGVGYAAMSKHVVNAGAFYAYIARGLGRPAGVGAAFVALISYNAITIAFMASAGFYAHEVFASVFSIDLPWQIWSALVIGLVAFLGRRQVDISAKMLGVALLAEAVILLVLDVAIVGDLGISAFSLDSFSPSTVFSGAAGVGFLYAFLSFIGFEATAIFGEESKDPTRTVPRATYAAVILIGVFYTLTSWAILTGAGGAGAAQAVAQNPALFVFGVNEQYVGGFTTDAMQVLIVTSFFAGTLALHNASARYFFALGRAGLLPAALGRVNGRHGSPANASAAQIALGVLVVGGFAIVGGDPYLDLGAPAAALGTIGIIGLQAACAVSVVAFFRRRSDSRMWTTVIAPALGAAGLSTAAVLVVENYAKVTGRASGVANQLPWLLVIALLAGVGLALRLRSSAPAHYAALGEDAPTGAPAGDPAVREPPRSGAEVAV